MIFQLDWLKCSILDHLSKQPNFSNPLISKNFTKTINVTPILRINRFIKTTNTNGITAILSDLTHKIFAVFPLHPTIVNYENFYHERITYHTKNCHILIKKANLRFISRQQAREDYDLSVEIDIVVLEILDLEIFLRDQETVSSFYERSLTFVYDEPEYRKNVEQEIFGEEQLATIGAE